MSTTAAPARPGRPRSEDADERIHVATRELLASDGYAKLTMSGIAHGAGVSTATLYRRWPSKLELVIDVLRAQSEEDPLPDTGSLRGDIAALAHSVVERFTTTTSGPIVRALIDEIGRNDVLAVELRQKLIAPRRTAVRELLQRAAARGELRRGLDDDLVLDLVFGPVYHRLLVTGDAVDDAVINDLTDLILRAIGR